MSAVGSPNPSTGGKDGGEDKKKVAVLASQAVKRMAVEWSPFNFKKAAREDIVKRTLRSTPLFENLSSRDWRLLAELFHIRSYEAGEPIFEQDTPGLGMYVIVEGKVKIITMEEEKEVILAILTNGDFFGEMSLIDEIERSAGAVAVSKTMLVGLFRPQLRELMNHRPRLGNTIFERLAKIVVMRLRESNQMLMQQIKAIENMDDNPTSEAEQG